MKTKIAAKPDREWNVGDALESSSLQLEEAGIETPRMDARILLALAMRRESATLDPQDKLEAGQSESFWDMITRRTHREPVSHIRGSREFWGLDFKVGPQVLDPRPDTETLVEAALHHMPSRGRDLRVLDMGTGSGCILLSLLSEFPRAEGVAVDISEEALSLASENALKLGLAARVRFEKSDWGREVTGRFDLIVSNPPYIEEAEILRLQPEVRDFEPHLALSGGPDGLQCYRQILADAHRLLLPQGLIMLEIGQGQEATVPDLVRAAGLTVIDIRKDLSSIPRCIVARLNH